MALVAAEYTLQFAARAGLTSGLRALGQYMANADRRYYLDGSTTAAGFAAVVPGTPRSLQVSLDYTF